MNYGGLLACAALLAIAFFKAGVWIERRRQETKNQAIQRISEKYRPERDR